MANGYVYVFGGYGSSNLSTVYYAKLNSNGTVGEWSSTTILPQTLSEHSSVVANGYVYVFGGKGTGLVRVTSVYYASLARISMAGTLDLVGLTSGSLTDSSGATGGTIYAGDIYSNNNLEVAGNATVWGSESIGGNLTVQGISTAFNAGQDGSLGNWSSNTTLIPRKVRDAASLTANGYYYIVGGDSNGNALTSVYYAKIKADGSLGAFSLASTLPVGIRRHTSILSSGYIYTLGGDNSSGDITTNYYAKLNSDGTTGTWYSTTALPDTRIFHSSVAANGYVYVIGGEKSFTRKSTVFYSLLKHNKNL